MEKSKREREPARVSSVLTPSLLASLIARSQVLFALLVGLVERHIGHEDAIGEMAEANYAEDFIRDTTDIALLRSQVFGAPARHNATAQIARLKTDTNVKLLKRDKERFAIMHR